MLKSEPLACPQADKLAELKGTAAHDKMEGKVQQHNPEINSKPKTSNSNIQNIQKYEPQADELAELKGTAAHDKMEGKVQQPADAPTQLEHLWKEVVQPFIAENPVLGLPSDEAGKKLYLWATAVVSSYSFMLGDDKYQVRWVLMVCVHVVCLRGAHQWGKTKHHTSVSP